MLLEKYGPAKLRHFRMEILSRYRLPESRFYSYATLILPLRYDSVDDNLDGVLLPNTVPSYAFSNTLAFSETPPHGLTSSQRSNCSPHPPRKQ